MSTVGSLAWVRGIALDQECIIAEVVGGFVMSGVEGANQNRWVVGLESPSRLALQAGAGWPIPTSGPEDVTVRVQVLSLLDPELW